MIWSPNMTPVLGRSDFNTDYFEYGAEYNRSKRTDTEDFVSSFIDNYTENVLDNKANETLALTVLSRDNRTVDETTSLFWSFDPGNWKTPVSWIQLSQVFPEAMKTHCGAMNDQDALAKSFDESMKTMAIVLPKLNMKPNCDHVDGFVLPTP